MYCLHLQGMLGILFNLDDGGSMFLHENYRRVQTEPYKESIQQSVRSEAVMAAIIIRNIFWDVITCSLIEDTDISASTFWVCLFFQNGSKLSLDYVVSPLINTVVVCVVTLQLGRCYHYFGACCLHLHSTSDSYILP